MKRTVLFIIDSPILNTYRTYYALEAFEKANYEIKMLDISPVINKSAYKKVTTGLMNYDGKNICRCHTYLDFYKFIDQIDGKIIAVDSGAFSLQYRKIYEYLHKKGIPYGYIILNSCYENATGSKGIKKVSEFIKHISFTRILNLLYRRIPKFFLHIDPATFVISNSIDEEEHYRKRFYCPDETKFLVVHSNTYEEALKIKYNKPLIKGKYCVWLDSYIPYHPDLSQLNAALDPERYYSPLRRFFRWIESEYGIEVVVSAHPRSDYEMHPAAYEGFKVIKGETCALVRDSEFVITAASTSFLYGITYEKPMLFVYQEELVNQLPTHIVFMNTLADELNTKTFCIDSAAYDKNEIDELLEIDKVRYEKVGKRYICPSFDGRILGKSYEQQIIDLFELII